MFHNESKLTKWTLVLCFGIIALYFSCAASANEEEDVSDIGRLCVAAYFGYDDVLLIKTKADIKLKQVINDQFVWWVEFLAAWHGASSAEVVFELAKDEYVLLSTAYNAGTLDFEDIKALGVRCFEIRYEIENGKFEINDSGTS